MILYSLLDGTTATPMQNHVWWKDQMKGASATALNTLSRIFTILGRQANKAFLIFSRLSEFLPNLGIAPAAGLGER